MTTKNPHAAALAQRPICDRHPKLGNPEGAMLFGLVTAASIAHGIKYSFSDFDRAVRLAWDYKHVLSTDVP